MEIIKQEQWKDIDGFEGKYQISTLGRVRSLKRKTNNQFCKDDKILSPSNDGYGYSQVVLCRHVNGVRVKKVIKVHRLVANAFIPNKYNKPLINHKDWNRMNNYYTNLEWVTSKENLNHRKPKTDKPKRKWNAKEKLHAQYS